ncbi:MAG: hypothetical protein KC613_03585 [Myxococcales bacterium]|nr:hypothetical protein [Myxococcales bacterium]MCB9522564.1 hypothetical protein [Myxococcales bacterium]
MPDPTPRPIARWILGLLALAFGAATLKSGGAVLFGDGAARAAAGQVVEWVLWFNFCAGFLYVAAGAATLANRRPALWLAQALAVATLAVFAALAIHIARGGPHEARTVIAMTVRSLFWVGQALALRRLLR